MLKRIKPFALMAFTWLPLAANCALPGQLIDLTYSFDKKTIYWPTEKPFKLQKVFYGETPRGYFYLLISFAHQSMGGRI